MYICTYVCACMYMYHIFFYPSMDRHLGYKRASLWSVLNLTKLVLLIDFSNVLLYIFVYLLFLSHSRKGTRKFLKVMVVSVILIVMMVS